jgi:copper(I)-binding protein
METSKSVIGFTWRVAMYVRNKVGPVFVVILTLFFCACGGNQAPAIDVQEPWARSAGMMGAQEGAGMESNGAAYMVIVNSGDVADKLLRVESDVSGAVELHKSEIKDGVMRMNPVEYIEVPANGQVELMPGGLHIMLIGLNQELRESDTVMLNLVFEKSGQIMVNAEVRAP